ncbi:MAG: LamG domain-containing protein [Planctomycetales bacterium]|nr:LamG domain-containing protein [Planctomycetales bacterium]
MSSDRRIEHEIARILLAAIDGDATSDELAEVNRLVLEDPRRATVVVDVMTQDAWLTWNNTKTRNGGSLRNDLLDQIMAAAQEATHPAAPMPAPHVPPTAVAARRSFPFKRDGTPFWAALAAAFVVALGWTLGFQHAKREFADRSQQIAVTLPDDDTLTPNDGHSPYVARFVQGTACLWSSQGESAFINDHALRMGEALNLLEGLAELQIDWSLGNAVLKIEGPAGLVLTADHGACLSHGKLSADVTSTGSTFRLTTPNCDIEVSEDASLGLAITGSQVELHVFRGHAAAVVPWTDEAAGMKRVAVNSGESLSIAAEEGRVHLEAGLAAPDEFASQRSMGADNLHISPEYVRAILAAKPLLYWRFEGDDPRRVVNSAGDRYHGQVVGSASRVRHDRNQVLDLGSAMSDDAYSTYVISDEPVSETFDDGYAVEAWIKPSHYHWATFAAMIGPRPQPNWACPHACLLELGGPRAAETAIEHPGRIRFLHRSPPSTDAELGTSVFSESPYDVRKWQHVVGVKLAGRMLLYVNGQLSATATDPTALVSDWRLVVGQLDEDQDYRRYIGQIDELAVYPRPLSEDEVREHYEMARNPRRQSPDALPAVRTVRADAPQRPSESPAEI